MVKVAAIGCGGIMQQHYHWLSQRGDVKLVGHCDVEIERAEDAAGRFGGKAFKEFEPLYDKTKPDAVYIAVPPYAHCGMEEAAAERGIHLFIEKPLGIRRETGKRIANALRAHKVLCSVGYCYRYNSAVQHARRLLKNQPIALITGAWTGAMPGVWWWRRMDRGGGQIVEQTTHIIDLMRYLCGEVAEVHAVASTGCMTQVEHFDVHDSSVVNMRLKNGASASIASACVCGHGGRVALEVVTPGLTITFRNHVLVVQEDGKTTEYAPKGNMYQEETQAFIEAVQTGKRTRIRSSYPDALKTFLVTCAANASIASGLPAKP